MIAELWVCYRDKPHFELVMTRPVRKDGTMAIPAKKWEGSMESHMFRSLVHQAMAACATQIEQRQLGHYFRVLLFDFDNAPYPGKHTLSNSD